MLRLLTHIGEKGRESVPSGDLTGPVAKDCAPPSIQPLRKDSVPQFESRLSRVRLRNYQPSQLACYHAAEPACLPSRWAASILANGEPNIRNPLSPNHPGSWRPKVVRVGGQAGEIAKERQGWIAEDAGCCWKPWTVGDMD
ncbi:uncharacterized protein LOC124682678 isoform X2 [Lolium rigidum]|uniref:uncharacterized protein LOC124682678 isoform X2 n=1 Tax=Lolium rigidum TaxID=89674 RepID=UPI001F5C454B|nr:uncharacterized protein LOC124682678 isoform X2 [Lolium rigidum]